MKPLFTLAAILLAASFATAEPITYKDWMVNNAPDEIFQRDACLAATNVAKGTNRAQLLLSFTKDQQTVPQLLLKVWDQAAPEPQLFMKVSSKVSYPLFLYKAATQPEEPNVYWYAPIGWSPLRDHIAAATVLNVQGATTKLEVSLRGSSVSLERTLQCLKANSLLPLDFLKTLNLKTETQGNLYASVDEMIQGNELSFEQYRQGVVKTKELADLRKGSAKLLNQEKEALTVFNSAEKTFQTAKTALQVQIDKQSTLQTTLDQSKADLTKFQTELPIAQDIEKQKFAAYDPVRREFVLFVADVGVKQNALDKNINDTKSHQNRIAKLEKDIPAYRNELNNLSGRINSLRSDVDNARRVYRDRQNDADSYNVDREYRNELSRDFSYNNSIRDFERYRDEARRHEQDANRARNEARSAEAQLVQCKRQDPAVDCSRYENDVRRYQSEERDHQSRARSANSSASSASSSADWRARSILSDIERKKSSLESEAYSARSRLNSLESDLDSLQTRYSNISNALPRMREDLAYSKDQVPKLQAQKPVLEAALADSTQKLEEARVRLDVDRIASEYNEAAARVIDIKNGITTSQQSIVNSEAGLKKIKPVIDSLTKDLTAKTVKRDQAAQKLAPIQEALKPFREQEATITKTITDLAAGLDLSKSRYQRTYEKWITPSTTWMSIGVF